MVANKSYCLPHLKKQQPSCLVYPPEMVAIASYCAVSLKCGRDTSTGCRPLGSAGGSSTLLEIVHKKGSDQGDAKDCMCSFNQLLQQTLLLCKQSAP